MRFRNALPFFTATLAIAVITLSLAVSTQAQTVLYNFPDGHQGADPQSRLTADPAGNLYGTTFYGGANTSVCDSFGAECGTVFELSPGSGGTWTYHLLHLFSGDANGGRVIRGLVRDSSGNLYGTTSTGGDVTDCVGASYPGAGCGVVFKLSENAAGMWKETVLYTFTGGTDGGIPSSNLTLDAAGNLYGSTHYGGSLSSCNGVGCGVVFRLRHTSTGWHESVLRSFDFSVDGQYPGDLVQDAAGNLYGASDQGPNFVNCSEGCGVVWELSPTASGPWSESILYTFQGGNDGANPLGGLILDSAGNLYGTTEQGGSSGNGTVFELSPTASGPWTETQLFVFDGTDGMFPESSLLFDSAGNLYGTTAFGGSTACSNGCGTAFELSPSGSGWTRTSIASFNGTNGFDVNGLIFGPDGNLYGSTEESISGYGVVFELAP